MDLNHNGFCCCSVGRRGQHLSVINENQATEETVEEGATVSVTSKTPKGKSVIYKALVLKVFGEYTNLSLWNFLKIQ